MDLLLAIAIALGIIVVVVIGGIVLANICIKVGFAKAQKALQDQGGSVNVPEVQISTVEVEKVVEVEKIVEKVIPLKLEVNWFGYDYIVPEDDVKAVFAKISFSVHSFGESAIHSVAYPNTYIECEEAKLLLAGHTSLPNFVVLTQITAASSTFGMDVISYPMYREAIFNRLELKVGNDIKFAYFFKAVSVWLLRKAYMLCRNHDVLSHLPYASDKNLADVMDKFISQLKLEKVKEFVRGDLSIADLLIDFAYNEQSFAKINLDYLANVIANLSAAEATVVGKALKGLALITLALEYICKAYALADNQLDKGKILLFLESFIEAIISPAAKAGSSMDGVLAAKLVVIRDNKDKLANYIKEQFKSLKSVDVPFGQIEKLVMGEYADLVSLLRDVLNDLVAVGYLAPGSANDSYRRVVTLSSAPALTPPYVERPAPKMPTLPPLPSLPIVEEPFKALSKDEVELKVREAVVDTLMNRLVKQTVSELQAHILRVVGKIPDFGPEPLLAILSDMESEGVLAKSGERAGKQTWALAEVAIELNDADISQSLLAILIVQLVGKVDKTNPQITYKEIVVSLAKRLTVTEAYIDVHKELILNCMGDMVAKNLIVVVEKNQKWGKEFDEVSAAIDFSFSEPVEPASPDLFNLSPASDVDLQADGFTLEPISALIDTLVTDNAANSGEIRQPTLEEIEKVKTFPHEAKVNKCTVAQLAKFLFPNDDEPDSSGIAMHAITKLCEVGLMKPVTKGRTQYYKFLELPPAPTFSLGPSGSLPAEPVIPLVVTEQQYSNILKELEFLVSRDVSSFKRTHIRIGFFQEDGDGDVKTELVLTRLQAEKRIDQDPNDPENWFITPVPAFEIALPSPLPPSLSSTVSTENKMNDTMLSFSRHTDNIAVGELKKDFFDTGERKIAKATTVSNGTTTQQEEDFLNFDLR